MTKQDTTAEKSEESLINILVPAEFRNDKNSGREEKAEKGKDPEAGDATKKTEEKIVSEDPPKKEGIENEEIPVPIPQKKHPEVTEDDYVEKDGKIVEIKAQHILDDIDEIKNRNAETFLKIVNRKGGEKKADIIAKALGFKADSTREPYEVARDMIKKFISLAKDDLEGAKEFASKNFPEELLDPEHKINSNIEEKGDGDEKSPSRLTLPGLDFTKEEVMSETESYVKENLYKRVDKSMTDEEVQAEKEAFIKELNGSKELLEELKSHKFNPTTGEKLSLSEIFSLSANKIMESKKKAPERKYDSGMDNNKITPKTDSGDSSGSFISILTNGLIK